MTIRTVVRVLSHPSVRTFEAERPRARMGAAVLLTFRWGAAAGLLGGGLSLFLASRSIADMIETKRESCESRR